MRHIPRAAAHYIQLVVLSPPTLSHCSPHACYVSREIKILSNTSTLNSGICPQIAKLSNLFT